MAALPISAPAGTPAWLEFHVQISCRRRGVRRSAGLLLSFVWHLLNFSLTSLATAGRSLRDDTHL